MRRLMVGIAALCLAAGMVRASDPKPWAEILGPSQGKWPAPRQGLPEVMELFTHRAETAKTKIPWMTNVREAMEVAKREDRPLFVTFRCLPCKSCSEFDKTVLEGGDDLDPLFLQFITVRVTSTMEVDLRLLPMPKFQDMDVSWWSWFLSPEGKVYGVFGGRDKDGDQGRTSKAALIKTMHRVLDHHYDPRRATWDLDGSAAPKDGKAVTPVDQPGYANWLTQRQNANLVKTQGCIHCHQTSEILRQNEMDAGRFDKHRDLDIWPLPENIGVVVDRDDGIKVTGVQAGSPAAAAGIRPGDEIAAGTDVDAATARLFYSQADLRAFLNRAPKSGTLQLKLRRDGNVADARLDLPDGWKRTDLSWRPSVAGANIGGHPGFFATSADTARHKLGLAKGVMAIKPILRKPVSEAGSAGLKPDDTVISVNGESPDLFGGPFMVWFRMKFEPGDPVTLTVKDALGEQRDIAYKAGR